MNRLRADQFNLPYQALGNPKGPAILILHGGPGFAALEEDAEKFDLSVFKVILFQQRGAFLSGRPGDITNNTTSDLVEDIENLRKALNLSSWIVYGQSWGTFLGLCYAIKYPKRVTHLLMKGVFLGRKEDIDWLYSETGIGSYSPEVRKEFDKLRATLNLGSKNNVLEDFAKVALQESPDIKACINWTIWEDINCVAKHEEMVYPEVDDTYEKISLAMARIETHYFINNCFVEDNYVLNNLYKVQCPISIFHGDSDRICPQNQANALFNEAQNNLIASGFYLIKDCGHSSNDEMKSCINKVSSGLYEKPSSLMAMFKAVFA